MSLNVDPEIKPEIKAKAKALEKEAAAFGNKGGELGDAVVRGILSPVVAAAAAASSVATAGPEAATKAAATIVDDASKKTTAVATKAIATGKVAATNAIEDAAAVGEQAIEVVDDVGEKGMSTANKIVKGLNKSIMKLLKGPVIILKRISATEFIVYVQNKLVNPIKAHILSLGLQFQLIKNKLVNKFFKISICGLSTSAMKKVFNKFVKKKTREENKEWDPVREELVDSITVYEGDPQHPRTQYPQTGGRRRKKRLLMKGGNSDCECCPTINKILTAAVDAHKNVTKEVVESGLIEEAVAEKKEEEGAEKKEEEGAEEEGTEKKEEEGAEKKPSQMGGNRYDPTIYSMEALDNGVWRLRGFSFNEILNIIDGSLPLLKGLDDTGKKNTKGNIRLKDIKKTKSNTELKKGWVRHVERDEEPVKFLWWEGKGGKKKYLQVSKLDTETKSDKETDILISVITKKNGTQKRKRGGKLGRGRKKRRSRTNKKRRKKRRRRKTLNRRSPKRRRSFKKRK